MNKENKKREYENQEWLENWIKHQSKKFRVYWNGLLNGSFPQTDKEGNILKDSDGNTKFIKRKSLVERLDISREELTGDLKIDDWANLKVLNVGDNELTSLEISNCPKLEKIICSHNGKKVLQKISDSEVKIKEEKPTLTKLTITNCPNVRRVYVSCNDLQELDLRGLPKLRYLFCGDNPKLTDQNIKILDTTSLVDSSTFSEGEAPRIDAQTYVDNLSLMDHLGNHLTPEEVTELDLTECSLQGPLSLTRFPNLESLDLSNNFLTNLDLRNCHNLKSLTSDNNQLTAVIFPNNSNLETINLNNNQLEGFDTKNLENLKGLSLTSQIKVKTSADGKITRERTLSFLDLTPLTNLKYLNCAINNLNILDLKNNSKLESLNCYSNEIKTLSILHLKKLESLYCYRNFLEKLNVEKLKNLKEVFCAHQNLGKERGKMSLINVHSCDSLEILDCAENSLKELDISGLTNLHTVSAKENLIKVLNAKKCSGLTYLDFSKQFSAFANFSYSSKINLDDCSSLENLKFVRTFADISFLEKLPNFEKITHLEISFSFFSTKKDLLDILKVLKNLEYLKITTDSDDDKVFILPPFFKDFQNLRHLDVTTANVCGELENLPSSLLCLSSSEREEFKSFSFFEKLEPFGQDIVKWRNTKKIKHILDNPNNYSWNDLDNIDKKDLYGVPTDLRDKLISLIVEKFNEKIREEFKLPDEEEKKRKNPPKQEEETPEDEEEPAPQTLPPPKRRKSEPEEPTPKNNKDKDQIIDELKKKIAKLQEENESLKSKGKKPDSKEVREAEKKIKRIKEEINNSKLDENKKKELLKLLEDLAKKNRNINNNSVDTSSSSSHNYNLVWIPVLIGQAALLSALIYAYWCDWKKVVKKGKI